MEETQRIKILKHLIKERKNIYKNRNNYEVPQYKKILQLVRVYISLLKINKIHQIGNQLFITTEYNGCNFQVGLYVLTSVSRYMTDD